MKAANVACASIASLALVCSSCATMLKGTTDNMVVVSDPSGAKVVVNDELKGNTTPVSFTVPSKQDLNVHVSKDGYQSQDIYSGASFRWGYEIWAFIAWVIPFVVDLSDGAAWGHDPTTLTAHLEPLPQANVTPSAPPVGSLPSTLAQPPPSSSSGSH